MAQQAWLTPSGFPVLLAIRDKYTGGHWLYTEIVKPRKRIRCRPAGSFTNVCYWGASCQSPRGSNASRRVCSHPKGLRERRPHWWLMYATVAVLSERTSICFSCSSVLKRRRAIHTASNSRQLICHCSWGPVQSPAAACPLHMAPQPVAEASVETTTCLDTCSRGTSARRKQDPTMGWRCDGRTGWVRPGMCRGAMPISGLGREANAEAVSYEAIRAAW